MALNYLPFLNKPVTKPTGHEPFATFTEKYASLAQNYDGLPYIADTRPVFPGADRGPRALLTKPIPHPPASRSDLPLPFTTVVYNANALHVPDFVTLGEQAAARNVAAKERAAALAYVPKAKPGIDLLYATEVMGQESRIAERKAAMRAAGKAPEVIEAAMEPEYESLRSLLQRQAQAESGVSPSDLRMQQLFGMSQRVPVGAADEIMAAAAPAAAVAPHLAPDAPAELPMASHARDAGLERTAGGGVVGDGMAGNNPTGSALVVSHGAGAYDGKAGPKTPAEPPVGATPAVPPGAAPRAALLGESRSAIERMRESAAALRTPGTDPRTPGERAALTLSDLTEAPDPGAGGGGAAGAGASGGGAAGAGAPEASFTTNRSVGEVQTKMAEFDTAMTTMRDPSQLISPLNRLWAAILLLHNNRPAALTKEMARNFEDRLKFVVTRVPAGTGYVSQQWGKIRSKYL